MKTPEDEAFDDLARRQGAWGGGYQAKRKAASDKQHWNEDEWRRNNWRCGHGWLRGEQCEICNAPLPAQEPVAWVWKDMRGQDIVSLFEPRFNSVPLYTAPLQREWVGLTDGEIAQGNKESWVDRQAFESAVWWAEAKLKEKNG